MDEKEFNKQVDRYTPVDKDKIREIEKLICSYIPLNIAAASTKQTAEGMLTEKNKGDIALICFVTGFYYANVYAQEQKEIADKLLKGI